MKDENKNIPQLDRSKLTNDQLAQLDTLRTLEDIASMLQGILDAHDEDEKKEGDTVKQYGALLVDIRDNLSSINAKEAPETPDQTKPVISAVEKLEKALTKAINSIEVKPQVNVDAPQVSVNPTPVDLKGVEKVLKTDIPDAFKKAISAIPAPERVDFAPLLGAFEGISQQLLSLENVTRMKPLPGSMKVTNTDGTPISSGALVREKFDYVSRALLSDGVTEVYTYRLGGQLGTLVATVSVVYSDSTLATFVSATRT